MFHRVVAMALLLLLIPAGWRRRKELELSAHLGSLASTIAFALPLSRRADPAATRAVPSEDDLDPAASDVDRACQIVQEAIGETPKYQPEDEEKVPSLST